MLREEVDEARLKSHLAGCGRLSAEEISSAIRRDLDTYCRSATRDDVTLLVIKVPASRSRAPSSSFEAGEVSADIGQDDLELIARMASEGGSNC